MKIVIMYMHTFMPITNVCIYYQSRQNGYQTVPFGVHISDLIFVFTLE